MGIDQEGGQTALVPVIRHDKLVWARCEVPRYRKNHSRVTQQRNAKDGYDDNSHRRAAGGDHQHR